ncbi:ABC transporter permease [Planosporangium mesophilum]|uniref:ABC transporter permease n=1 Tax=Planosporangium mesophilum TaxID=689768 RepID=A0A8J3TCP5_9ACTN|nr:ABC transporter permease subunit [Planosporangium mesophilum]NJC85164.1 ABC transporter permease subunit [Planosporangium mesophilum]GII24308.1 ABC transporter permease [Planosporangium mesophilum]
MSVVEAPVVPVRRPSTRLLRSELWLIFGRRRNWAGLAILAVVPTIIAIAVKVSPPGGGGEGPNFFASITSNGLFVALAALTVELPLFLPLAVAAISADAIAGEANLGTLRYLLTVPVERVRMLAVKYTAIVIFALTATLLVAAVGALLGLALFGGGPVTTLSGTQLSFADGVLRLLGVCVYIACGLAALGAIGLFVSTLTEQPIGATVAILIVNVLSFVLDSIPQLSWLHPYLLTHYWMNYGDLLRDPVSWSGTGQGALVAGAYALVFWTAAWARFAGRDVTS